MTSSRLVLAAAALTALASMGCKETVSSTNIRTQGIAMLTDVVATSATNVIVTTDLRVGGNESNTFVILDSGDALYLEVDGERSRMMSIDDGVYEASSDVGDEDTEYKVILEREVDDMAGDNLGTLPAPFEITSDFTGMMFSRETDDIELTWEPSGTGDDMEVVFREVGCVFREAEEIGGDPGSFTLSAGTLNGTDNDMPETCDVEVTLSRKRTGSTDSTLDSESWFRLAQIRTITFTSAP